MNVNGVPVFVINRNRLASTKQLIDWLLKSATEKITILDNESTYPPLLAYYKALPQGVSVRDIGGNLGPGDFWAKQWHLRQDMPYVISDADCVPSIDCPQDLIPMLLRLLERFPHAGKVGAGLRIDNLPDCYGKKAAVLSWEARFWQRRACLKAFYAAVDTTFALYPARGVFCNHDGNLRTDAPYLVEHVPWYADSRHLTEEEQYYKEHTSASWSSWYTVF